MDFDVIWPKTPDPSLFVETMLVNFGHAANPTSAHLWLFDPATDTLRLVAAAGPLPPAALPVAHADTLLGRALDSASEVLAPLDRVITGAVEGSLWRFAVSLSSGEAQGVAAIDLRSATEPNRSRLARVVPSTRTAGIAAISHLIAAQEVAAAHVLLDAARDLTRLLDPQAVIDAMLVRAMRLSDASTGSVLLVSEHTQLLQMAASRGLPDDVVRTTSVPAGEGIAGLVLSTGKPLVVEDLPGRMTGTRRHGVRTAVSVPIADEDGTLGVLNVGCKTFAARLSDHTLSTLEDLGTLGAIALRNARASRVTSDLYFDTLKTLALALETKDPFAHGGTERVVNCATALGAAMGLEVQESRSLEVAALLHDIGMIATGDSTGVRQRPLTTVEWGLLKMHPVIAAELLEQAPSLKEVAPIVYHHHERYDGGGYGAGLAGDAIPLPARILAVADAYVAMTSDRPYHKAVSHEAALLEMRANAGTQFDPHVVGALAELVDAELQPTPSWSA